MRQRVSITQKAIDNLKFRVTHRKPRKKQIPASSQIATFDYVGGLLRAKWDRMRTTR
ncbi:NinE family protein [Mixta calida]|uniref:NinE family protein n=1 Tax=Mixta calida TaxID=665913 RepID=UPI00403AE31E